MKAIIIVVELKMTNTADSPVISELSGAVSEFEENLEKVIEQQLKVSAEKEIGVKKIVKQELASVDFAKRNAEERKENIIIFNVPESTNDDPEEISKDDEKLFIDFCCENILGTRINRARSIVCSVNVKMIKHVH